MTQAEFSALKTGIYAAIPLCPATSLRRRTLLPAVFAMQCPAKMKNPVCRPGARTGFFSGSQDNWITLCLDFLQGCRE